MSANFFQGSLDDEIRRELNRYLTPLQDYVHRNRHVLIKELRIRAVDYDSIVRLLNLYDREFKHWKMPVQHVQPGSYAVGFYYDNRWIVITPKE